MKWHIECEIANKKKSILTKHTIRVTQLKEILYIFDNNVACTDVHGTHAKQVKRDKLLQLEGLI